MISWKLRGFSLAVAMSASREKRVLNRQQPGKGQRAKVFPAYHPHGALLTCIGTVPARPLRRGILMGTIMVRPLLLALAAVAWAAVAGAQQLGWVQIEARPNEPQALERAQDYAAQLPNVNSFALPSGWYAITLGPYDPITAEQELRRLRASVAIPGDSFISDGRGFGRRIYGQGLAVQPETIAVEPPRELVPAEESPAQSRAAERLLTRAERAQIQEALQWEGFYSAAIDASFGAGTRRAMESWQI